MAKFRIEAISFFVVGLNPKNKKIDSYQLSVLDYNHEKKNYPKNCEDGMIHYDMSKIYIYKRIYYQFF